MLREVNFYLLLDLSINPPEENEAIILSAINKKRSLWSSMMNHPTKKNEAMLYLEMIPLIKAVMLGNKIERQKEAKRAKEIKEKALLRKQKKLIDIVRVLELKGYISKEEYERLKSDFYDLGENLIKKTLRKLKIRNTFYNENNTLDPTIYNKIKNNLKIIGKDSLYDFLGIPQNTSVEELRRASKLVYESLRKIPKKNSNVTARGELQGFCDIVFKDLKSKREYDNKIRTEKLKDIEEIIEVCGSKRFITTKELYGIKILIKKRGFTEKESQDFLINFCIKNRICLVCSEKENVKKSKYYENNNDVVNRKMVY